MRPEKLIIEGLASYRERQTVDFTALDDIFAIVGPTGSGKSTILDGMSLALFGALPRGGTTYSDFVSLGLPRALVEFTFTVGPDRYVVARKFPRKGGSQSAKLERILPDGTHLTVGEEGVKSVTASVVALLGFNYDTFRRVVLLPQGEFAEFLRGKADERRTIIMRLLGYTKYVEAGRIARERAADWRRQADQWRTVLDAEYADATPEALAALRVQADELAVLVEAQTAARARVADLALSRDRAGTSLAQLERSRTALGSLARKTAALAAEALAFEPEHQAATERARATEGALAGAVAAGEAAEVALADHRSAVGADRDLEGRRLRLAESRRLATDLESARVELRATTQDAARSEVGVREARAAHDVAERALVAARDGLEEARGGLVTARAGRTAAEARTVALAARQSAEVAHAGAVARTAAAIQRVQEAEAQRAGVVAERDRLVREHHVAALTLGLSAGDPCPVCVRPLATVPGVEGTDHAALRGADSRVAEATRAVEVARDTADRARGDRSTAEAAREMARTEEERLGTGPDTAEAVAHEARALAALSAATRAVTQGESALKAASRTLAGAEQARARQTAAAEERTRRVAALEARGAEVASELGVTSPEDQERVAGETEGHIAMRARLVAALERATVAERRARSEHAAAEAGGRAVTERAQGVTRETDLLIERTRGAVEFCSLAAGRPAPGMDEVQDPSPLAALAQTHTALQRFVDASMVTVREAGAEAGRQLAVILDAAEARDPAHLDTIAQATRDAWGVAQGGIPLLEGRVAHRQSVEGQVETMLRDAERHRRLADDLQAHHFIKFLLDESFVELAERASTELNVLSGGQYSMRAEGYDFLVVDHQNADETRSVTTFSGGESFLASLSLAMALAQGIRDMAGEGAGARLESIFIDEGFGSLDPATLDVVVGALENLQGTGRQVGVITHVAPMAERIPSGLLVTPGPKGSTVSRRV